MASKLKYLNLLNPIYWLAIVIFVTILLPMDYAVETIKIFAKRGKHDE